MKAIVLAAGQGARLRPLSDERPKCMVAYQGVPLIDPILAWSRRMPADAETLKIDSIGLIKLSARGARLLRDLYATLDRAALYDGQPFERMYVTSLLQIGSTAASKSRRCAFAAGGSRSTGRAISRSTCPSDGSVE